MTTEPKETGKAFDAAGSNLPKQNEWDRSSPAGMGPLGGGSAPSLPITGAAGGFGLLPKREL